MKIETMDAGHETVLMLAGRLDVMWSDHFLETALECVRRGRHHLILDAQQVDYISSAGIRALLKVRREVSGVGGRIGICRPTEFVERVLVMSGMEEWIIAAGPEGQGAESRRDVSAADQRFSVTELEADGGMEVTRSGGWQPWRAFSPDHVDTLCCGPDCVALGVGGTGSDWTMCRDRFGEFLAVSGCMIGLPTDGGDKPDYLVQRQHYVPEVHALQAIVGRGRFSHRIRFQPTPSQGQVPLSELLWFTMTQLATDRVACVCVGEVDGLVGVALARSPGLVSATDQPAEFPEIRDWLTFSGERVHARQTAVVVAFASRHADERAVQWLSASPSQPALRLHAHAAVLPYRPLPGGEIDLAEYLSSYLEAVSPLDVLHLIDDLRPGVGLGESALVRGACWVAPWVPTGVGGGAS